MAHNKNETTQEVIQSLQASLDQRLRRPHHLWSGTRGINSTNRKKKHQKIYKKEILTGLFALWID